MYRVFKQIFFVTLIIFIFLSLGAFSCFAIDIPEDYTVLSEGDIVSVNLEGDILSSDIKITPDVDENYRIYSTDMVNYAFAKLYDSDMNLLTTWPDPYSDFNIEYHLKAGESYYLRISSFSFQGCSMNVHLERAHSYVSSVIEEESCFAPGLAINKCEYCDSSFEEVIPPAHHFGNNGICEDCPEIFRADGSCGENLSWTLEGNVLAISGSGPMTGWYWGREAPWREHADMIASVVIQEGVTDIGAFSFSYCTALEKISIPSGVKHIGERAFYLCKSLTGISIPATVESVGEELFYRCNKLEGISFEGAPPVINEYAFSGCDSLIVYYPHSGEGWTEDVMVNYGAESVVWKINHDFGDYAITVPPSDTAFGSAKRICKSCGFEEISDIPSGKYGGNISWRIWDGVLTVSGTGSIDDHLFTGEIPWQAYEADVTSLVVGEGITGIGQNSFRRMKHLAFVQLPASLEYIGTAAFDSCQELKSIIIPDGVKEIGGWAFASSGLESIILPRSLERIGQLAFSNCKLTEIVIPEQLLYIDANPFEGGFFERIYFMGNLPPMTDDEAFANFKGTIYIPESSSQWQEDFGQGHPMQRWSYSISGDANCTKAGVQLVKSSDGAVSFERSVLALGHSYSEMELVLAPTTQSEGKWRQKCSQCGLEKELSIPKFALGTNSPLISRNINGHNYGNYTDTTKSYLANSESGGFTRVEYANGAVYIEEYDNNFAFLSSKAVKAELPLFGGYYSDGNYHFLVFGQNNHNEDDAAEILRVVRYSMDWYRMDSASVYGANTTEPFRAGSLQMCSYGDSLYVRTCHEMYTHTDGKNHQANMSFIIHIPDMRVTAESAYLAKKQWCYVSHSFNQFILVDEGRLVAADHGDAYPRSVVLFASDIRESEPYFPDINLEEQVFPIVGETGANYTGVNVGGLEASDNYYLIAGNSIEQGGNDQSRNIFVTVTDKSSMSATVTRWLTHYSSADGVSVSNPHLVKINGNSFCLMWTEGSSLCYVFLDGSGEAVSEIYRGNAALSDCKPVLSGTRIVWYVTSSARPIFYAIDVDNPGELITGHSFVSNIVEPSCTEPGSASYTCTICGYNYSEKLEPLGHDSVIDPKKEPGCTQTGLSEGSHCSRCGLVLAEQEEIPAIGHSFEAVTHAPTCTEEGRIEKALCTVCGEVAQEESVLPPMGHSGEWSVVKPASYTQSGLKTRVCTVCGEKEEAAIPILIMFEDVPENSWYADAVAWAVEKEITSGMSKTIFAPGNPCTRAQAVTFLWRAAGKPTPQSRDNPFKDVGEGQYYYEAVLWAVENGVTNGLSADSFGPDKPCTRGQIVTFLWRSKGEPAASAEDNPFADVPEGSYFNDAVLWAVEREITSGVSSVSFAPDDTCTRAHIVTFLYRAR